MASYAPIALFVYKRLDLTRQTVEALQKNNLSRYSDFYIFSDAAKSEKDLAQVAAVREYIAKIDGFAKVEIIATPENLGCAHSIIGGVSKLFEKYEKIIVLEDDHVTTPNFLDYMNAALDFYKDKNAFSVEGWCMNLKLPQGYDKDTYFLPRGPSWGWSTWRDRWQTVDWAVSDYTNFKNDRAARKKFDSGGSDLSKMLDLQMAGRIDSWAIRFAYALYKSGMLNVVPKTSKVKNIGFGSDAQHTVNDPGYPLLMDDGSKTYFNFADNVVVDDYLLKQNYYYVSTIYKIKNRVRNELRKILRYFEIFCRK